MLTWLAQSAQTQETRYKSAMFANWLAVRARQLSCQTLLLTHQPLIAAGVFLRLPVVSFLHHCILTVRPRTPPLGWLRGRGGSMPAVVRGKRLRRFVLLLPRRAGFHLLPCDTTESRATRAAARARSRCSRVLIPNFGWSQSLGRLSELLTSTGTTRVQSYVDYVVVYRL